MFLLSRWSKLKFWTPHGYTEYDIKRRIEQSLNPVESSLSTGCSWDQLSYKKKKMRFAWFCVLGIFHWRTFLDGIDFKSRLFLMHKRTCVVNSLLVRNNNDGPIIKKRLSSFAGLVLVRECTHFGVIPRKKIHTFCSRLHFPRQVRASRTYIVAL